MTMRITVLSCVLMALLSTIGCGQRAKAPETQLTKDEVISIAEATARTEGYDIRKYNMTGCHYEFTDKDDTWTVSFVLKPPTPPGGHFWVVVDDWTKKATLMHGE